MKNLYIIDFSIKEDHFTKLSYTTSSSPELNKADVYAVIKSPTLENILEDIYHQLDWTQDTVTKAYSDGIETWPNVLCTKICDAIIRLRNVPFVCKRKIDCRCAESKNGSYEHGMQSTTFSYEPSTDPLTITSE